MSGRIRSLKPEWLEDEPLMACSSDARVLSAALLLLADDYGNGRAGELYLASRVFPGKSPETLGKALEELIAMRYLTLYHVDGQRYFAVRNWAKHQKVQHPGRPLVPEFTHRSEDVQTVSGESHETLTPDRDRRPGPTTNDREGISRASEDRFLDSLTGPDDELPEAWQPQQPNRDLAIRLGLDVAEELGLYSAHRRREKYRCGNWDADFEVWLRRSAKMARERAAKRAGGADPEWPTDDAIRLRESIRAGAHGESLRAKERAGRLDADLARRLIREQATERADRRQEPRSGRRPSSRPPPNENAPTGSLAQLAMAATRGVP